MEKKVLTPEEKKVLKSMFFRSHLVFTSFNMVKMEANGFTITMAPAIESIYKDDIASYIKSNEILIWKNYLDNNK